MRRREIKAAVGRVQVLGIGSITRQKRYTKKKTQFSIVQNYTAWTVTKNGKDAKKFCQTTQQAWIKEKTKV